MTEFKRVAVIGTGTMGPGMGATLARIGIDVAMYDVSAEALERAKGMVGMAEGVLDRLEAPSAPGGSVSYHDDLTAALEGRDMVLEAIPERLELKRSLFAKLGGLLGPDVLLATIAAGFSAGAIFVYRSSFQSMRSAIASITRSQPCSRSRCSS